MKKKSYLTLGFSAFFFILFLVALWQELFLTSSCSLVISLFILYTFTLSLIKENTRVKKGKIYTGLMNEDQFSEIEARRRRKNFKVIK